MSKTVPANIQNFFDAISVPAGVTELQPTHQGGGRGFVSAYVNFYDIYNKAVYFVSRLTDDAIHKLGGVEATKATVGEIYDKYISKIDIPYVPEFVETSIIDPRLRAGLLLMVDQIHNAVHKSAA